MKLGRVSRKETRPRNKQQTSRSHFRAIHGSSQDYGEHPLPPNGQSAAMGLRNGPFPQSKKTDHSTLHVGVGRTAAKSPRG